MECDKGKKLNFILPELSIDENQNPILLGSYHKSGTVWLKNWFDEWAKQTSRNLVNVKNERKVWKELSNTNLKNFIIFQNHTQFPRINGKALGIRIIRDPRDIILSGARYHKVSTEAWLHKRRLKYGLKTYCEKINTFQSFEETIDFEMRNAGKHTIDEMISFDTPGFLTVKYEDLFRDFNKHEIVGKISEHLLLKKNDTIALIEAFQRTHFLYSKKRNEHIFNAYPEQWKSDFTDELSIRFEQKFPNVLETLGYKQKV